MTDLPNPPDATPPEPASLFERHPWLPFILPLAVYMLAGSLEPTPDQPGGETIGLAIPYSAYPWVYAAKLLVTAATIALAWPVLGKFPLRVNALAVVVGVVGVVVWVGLCKLRVEQEVLAPFFESIRLGGIIPSGMRSAFNPFEQLAERPAAAWAFLAVRFLGLVVIVPIVEEVFYRGFLMRYITQPDWWKLPMGEASLMAVVMATLLPMAAHPGELLAAAAWFSMITWMYLRTKNLWDCIAAHAVTNLLLGVWVVYSGEWHLM